MIRIIAFILSFCPLVFNGQTFPEKLQGDVTDFIIEDEIQLNANGTGSNALYSPNYLHPVFQQNFTLSLDFSPSANNQFTWIIWADSDSLNHSANALFLQLGESGSDDKWRLFQVKNDEKTEIQASNPSFGNGLDNASFEVLVNDSTISLYQSDEILLKADFEIPFIRSGVSGFTIKFTSSNSTKTTIHQWSQEIVKEDTAAPQIIDYQWTSRNSIQVQTDEPIDSIWKIKNASFEKINDRLIQITINEKDVEWIWRDVLGNARAFNQQLVCPVPKMKDLCFTEFMIDPTPSLGILSDEEYIEIMNLSRYPLMDLPVGLVINEDTTWAVIPELPPDSFYVFYHPPSLNNESFDIDLINQFHELIDRFSFRSYWYDSPYSAGGWSLEKKDIKSFGHYRELWSFNTSFQGGSPNQANSLSSNYFPEPPFLNWIESTDNGYSYHFSEPIHASDTIWSFKSSNLEQIINLSGMPLRDTSVSVSTLEVPDFGDLVISEILFDETDETPEFIELTNTTNKTLLIDHLFLCEMENGNPVPFYELPDKKVVLPHEIFVITMNNRKLLRAFHCKKEVIIEDHQFPNLPNTDNHLVVMNAQQEIIDEIKYSDKFHEENLSYTEGVSLERIDTKAAGTEAKYWTSASWSHGYATPGLRNSQEAIEHVGTEIKLLHSIIRENEKIQLSYRQDQPGGTANLFLFDLNGRLQANLASNIVMGNEGTLQLDHTAPAGRYILLMEIYKNGLVERVKLGIAIGI